MNNFQLIFIILVILVVAFLITRLFMLSKKKSFDHSDIRLVDTVDNSLNDDSILSTERVAEDLIGHQPKENDSPGLDVVGLLHWYHDRVIKHKRSLKGAFQCLYLYFAFPVLACIIWTISYVYDNVYTMFYLYLGLVPSALIMIYYFKGRNKKIAHIINNSLYVELNEKQFPKIWTACYQIMQKMQLSHTLRIYYVKKDKAEASVVLEDNTIYLLLSRGMITYSQTKFKDVESILGHELGHVCQGDTKMMLIGKRAIQIPLIVMGLSWIIIALNIFIPLKGLLQMQVDLGMGWVLPFYCWLYIIQRREAEYLADMASLIFVENSTICELVEKHLPRMGTLNYPSRRRRIEYIRKIVSQYNKHDQPFPVIPQPVTVHSGS